MKEAGLSYSTCTLLMMKLIRKNNDYSQASERGGGGGGEGVAPPPIFFLQSYTNHKKNFLFFGPRISDKSTPPRSWPWHTILNFFYFFFMFLCFTRDSSFILFTYSCRSKVERFDLMKLILKCDSVLKIFQIFFFS